MLLRLLRNLGRMTRHIDTHIVLSEPEAQIRSLLVEFCQHYNARALAEAHLVLRITGGWVRDKLLGIPSNDLDIAVNHLLGEDFAARLLAYAHTHRPQLPLRAAHTIKKNPDKLKHLETCTTKLFGLDIDFVNLRLEQYTADSRVPVIAHGTAEEDALRRDATLNALFYNLNTGAIEDFTGRGLDDLRAGVLRTPLPPLQTFLDDPLRVLRLIRFAARFGFAVDDAALRAMRSAEIRRALVHKISRERVGVEVDKTLTSANPRYGLRLINYVGLTGSIFSAGALSAAVEEANDAATLAELAARARQVEHVADAATAAWPLFAAAAAQWPRLAAALAAAPPKLFWLSVILLPYGDLRVKTHPAKPNAALAVAEVILKEGLRFGRADFDPVVGNIRRRADNILSRFFASQAVPRSQLGLYLRSCGPHLQLNLAFNCFADFVEGAPAPPAAATPVPEDGAAPPTTSPVFAHYERLLAHIEHEGLTNVDALRPLVDGKTLLAALQRKPGPWLGRANEQMLVWQLDHPNASANDCIEHIRAHLAATAHVTDQS